MFIVTRYDSRSIPTGWGMRGNKLQTPARVRHEQKTNLYPAIEGNERFDAEKGPIGQLVSRALSVRPRGAIGNDGLTVQSLAAKLRVQLLARPIHPWDRDRPVDEKGELFVQQCLEDVSTAIPNLFRSMPEIDELEVTVMDPRGKRAIISGVVKRSDALASQPFSAGMKLRALGLEYGRSNFGFEQIENDAALMLD